VTNLARFKVNGTASSPGGYDMTNGQALKFALEGLTGVLQRWTFEVHSAADSYSPWASKNAPSLTLVGGTSGQKVDAATPAESAQQVTLLTAS
jgi:hypothetical protein